MPKSKEEKTYAKCPMCIGGQAFDIRGVLFCSPQCGNEYWGLKSGDEDYWSCSEEEEYESEEEEESKKMGCHCLYCIDRNTKKQ